MHVVLYMIWNGRQNCSDPACDSKSQCVNGTYILVKYIGGIFS